MKKLGLTTVLFVFLLFLSNGIQGQTTQTKLNQLELTKQWIGTWQHNTSKDTIDGWEIKAFGKAVIFTGFQIVKGKRTDSAMEIGGYDDRDDKVKGIWVGINANLVTFSGMFTTEHLFKCDALDTFKPDIIWWKNEMENKSSNELIIRSFNPKGVKTGELIFTKVK
jgi:hypothetical protein